MRGPLLVTIFSGFISISLSVIAAYGLFAAVILLVVAGGVRYAHQYVDRNLLETGPRQRHSLTVTRAGAESIVANIDYDFGEIAVSAVTPADLDIPDDIVLAIDYETNVANFRPVTRYVVADGVGTLDVALPVDVGIPNLRRLDEYSNRWDVRLPTRTPLNLTIEMGMSQGTIALAGLDLQDLMIEAGSGDLLVDLRGAWSRSFTTVVEGGQAQITLLLPVETGVRVDAQAGLGTVHVTGLHRLRDDDSVYVNDAYGQSDVTIDAEVEVGYGAVTLIVLPLGEHYEQK